MARDAARVGLWQAGERSLVGQSAHQSPPKEGEGMGVPERLEARTRDESLTTILRGHTLAFRGDPARIGPDAAVDFHADGAAAIAGGKIVAVGQALDVIARHPGARLETYANQLIMAGF